MNKPSSAARNRLVAFKTNRTLERAIREAARHDGRTTSAFLHFLVSGALRQNVDVDAKRETTNAA